MFSGGIGHYYYEPLPIHTVADAAQHDDVGPLLAESLRQHAGLSLYPVVRPAETLRATVRRGEFASDAQRARHPAAAPGSSQRR
jgi:ethanolamine utilization protein EutA (predicted chaperonin)